MDPITPSSLRPSLPRAASKALNPAADAAGLLRRVGFATLMLVVPAAAMLTRRALVVLAPIALILVVIAAILDGGHRPIGATWRRLRSSPVFLAAALALAWCAVSLAWTPFTAPAVERFANLLITVALGFAGYLAIPERMRSANLYLLPVGVGAAALVALVFGLLGFRVGWDEDGGSFERGLVVLSLLVWPALAWLRSRGRDLEALGLAILVAFAAIFAPRMLPVAALAAGAVAFALASLGRSLGSSVFAVALPGLLVVAPALPFILRPIVSGLWGSGSPAAASLGVWRRVVTSEPLRLVTGHGFDTGLRSRLVGLLPANAPNSLLFEIWYELGVVGALATAFALFAAITRAGRGRANLDPGLMAAFVAAFAVAALGIGMAQMWWFTTLAVLILLFVAIDRGQFRTTRPKAALIAPSAET